MIVLGGCGEEAPTSADLSLLPAEPVTVEIEVPWDEFGGDLSVQGGYGARGSSGSAIVARAYAGTLDANTLVRFGAYPLAASVRDTTGTLRTDTDLSFYGGYLVAFVDTLSSTTAGPVTLGAGALQTAWHRSATWEFAVDTLGDRQAWPEPGGGPVAPLSTAVWSRSLGDSVMLSLDSAQVDAWSDATDPARGARIELLTEGHRLRLVGVGFRVQARSSINPDTALVLPVVSEDGTFIYNPEPPATTEGLRVGGVPAWRSYMDVNVPNTLTGPPEICDVVQCPFTLGPGQVSYASLILTTRPTEDAYQPSNSIPLDARPVLSKETLPKAPLGTSLLTNGLALGLAPALFAPGGSATVEVPITIFARASLSGPDPSGRLPPKTVALLSAPEPWSFTYASFYGPDAVDEAVRPVLKLVVTVAPPLEVQ